MADEARAKAPGGGTHTRTLPPGPHHAFCCAGVFDVRMYVCDLQEERKPFDIDEYGDDMLKRLDEARGDAEENTVRTLALALQLDGGG